MNAKYWNFASLQNCPIGRSRKSFTAVKARLRNRCTACSSGLKQNWRNSMNNPTRPSTIEQKVQAAYQTIQPRPGFTARLHAEVAAQARTKKNPPRFFASFRLAMVGITLVLILTAVLILGPQTI